jgi:hypothetical protein
MQTVKKQGRFIFEPDQFLTASQIKWVVIFNRWLPTLSFLFLPNPIFLAWHENVKKNVQQLQKSLKSSEEALDNDEDLQSQAEEDENDFNSAVSDAQTYWTTRLCHSYSRWYAFTWVKLIQCLSYNQTKDFLQFFFIITFFVHLFLILFSALALFCIQTITHVLTNSLSLRQFYLIQVGTKKSIERKKVQKDISIVFLKMI